jgi:AcrR family transcriptional regulator
MALLQAGRRLFDDAQAPVLARVSVNAVVQEARMSKGAFYQHWPDRATYLLALHQEFHDGLTDLVTAAIAGYDPGLARLTTGITAYLDGCLAGRATKTLLAQARHEPELAAEVTRRDRQFADIARADLRALGWDPPEPAATLLVAMVAATALTESTHGTVDHALRNTIAAYISRGGTTEP